MTGSMRKRVNKAKSTKSKRKRLTICEKIACRGELATPLRIRVPAIVGGDLKLNFSRILCLLLLQCYTNGMGRLRAIIDERGNNHDRQR